MCDTPSLPDWLSGTYADGDAAVDAVGGKLYVGTHADLVGGQSTGWLAADGL